MVLRGKEHPTMKINVKKLDATIAKLQELRRLATDPILAPYVQTTGARPAPNGTTHRGSLAADAVLVANGHGALKANVLAACKGLSGTFTIKEVYAAMRSLGTSETGTEKSVANVLRLLASDGELRVAVKGQGRRATAYSNN